jgi:hypothetical protein
MYYGLIIVFKIKDPFLVFGLHVSNWGKAKRKHPASSANCLPDFYPIQALPPKLYVLPECVNMNKCVNSMRGSFYEEACAFVELRQFIDEIQSF